jgi:hypothetical protein
MRVRCSLVAVAFVLGCQDKTPPKEDAAPSASALAKGLGLDAAGLAPEPSDPVAPAGNLREEAERFSTLEQCVIERAKVDPLVGDAIRAIGYDTLFYDGCRVLHATKERDPKMCEPIVSSALRARCETLVAIARGDVESCPRVRETTVTRGRSPTCLAAASGDARLCQGEPKIPRIHCEALVMRDEKRCDWVPDDSLQPGMGKRSCLREVTRLRALLPEAKSGLPPLVTPKADLVVGLREEGDAGAPELKIDATGEVAQGVVIFPGYARREILDRTRFGMEIGVLLDAGPSFVAAGPTRNARLGLLVSFAKGGKDARIERAELDLPGNRTHAYPGDRLKSTVTITKLDDVRGGEVSLTFNGDFDQGLIPLKLEAKTFIRDVVTTVPATLPSPLLASPTTPTEKDAGLPTKSPWHTPRPKSLDPIKL